MTKPPKRPRDMMQLAKMVGELATGEREEDAVTVTVPREGSRRAREGTR